MPKKNALAINPYDLINRYRKFVQSPPNRTRSVDDMEVEDMSSLKNFATYIHQLPMNSAPSRSSLQGNITIASVLILILVILGIILGIVFTRYR